MKNFTLGLFVAYFYNRSGVSDVVKLTALKVLRTMEKTKVDS